MPNFTQSPTNQLEYYYDAVGEPDLQTALLHLLETDQAVATDTEDGLEAAFWSPKAIIPTARRILSVAEAAWRCGWLIFAERN